MTELTERSGSGRILAKFRRHPSAVCSTSIRHSNSCICVQVIRRTVWLTPVTLSSRKKKNTVYKQAYLYQQTFRQCNNTRHH
jgi:hypothetical protein